MMLPLLSLAAEAREYHFDPALIDNAGGHVDLTQFEQGGQLPGLYPVDILLNGEFVDAQDIRFIQFNDDKGGVKLTPCLTREQLAAYHVRVEDYPDAEKENGVGDGCFPLSAIPGASADFNFNNQTLLLNIPQLFMHARRQGIAPETLWNDGIPALLMNYQLGSTRTEYRHYTSRVDNSNWMQLQPGINLGAWRLRNNTNWQRSGAQAGKWRSVNTYAERGLNAIKSRLTLGESYTPADIFNSVAFRGVMLSSDEAMVPGSLYQFSPVVRGIARTQARVEVKQNGQTLYNALVPAGPFALTDLIATGSGGDLEVTIHETDGQPQVFIIPWQTPAIALREGYLKYNLMAGQYRSATGASPDVVQATAIYGLPANFTVYGGAQFSPKYLALSAGAGWSAGKIGAVSMDITESRSQHRAENGRELRLRYSKQFIPLNTTLSLSSEYSLSRGFHTLSDALENDPRYRSQSLSLSQKNRIGIAVNQGIGSLGYFGFSGYQARYWERDGYDSTFMATYTLPFEAVTLSLNWSQNRYGSRNNQKDQVTSLWMSVPLGRWLGGNTRASYRYTSPSTGKATHSLGVNGAALQRRLQWSASQQFRPGAEEQNNGNLNLRWNGTYGQASGYYGYSDSYRRTGAELHGGMLLHGKGLTLSQPLGETVALIEAPGAAGIQVGAWPGVKTDFRGFTSQSFLQPYQTNTVYLNPEQLPPDVDVAETDKSIVPTHGAVVPIKFTTRTGARALITVLQPDGRPVPYGALVTVVGEQAGTGIVADGGVTWLTGLQNKGALIVKWAKQQCQASYQLPAQQDAAGIYVMNAQCQREN